MDGHIAGSQWGSDFVACDVILKHHSLGRLGGTPLVASYRQRVEDGLRATVAASGSQVQAVRWLTREEADQAVSRSRGQPACQTSSAQCRFWFYPLENQRSTVRGDVFCIRELHLGIKAQEWGRTNDPPGFTTPGQSYADDFTRSFDVLSRTGPLARLKGLYDLVAAAEAMRRMGCGLVVEKLVHSYQIPHVATPTNYPLEELIGVVERADGQPQLLHMAGGISFHAEVEFITKGDIAPLRELVLGLRPGPRALAWPLPLDTWNMPNSDDLPAIDSSSPAGAATLPTGPGCSIGSQSVLFPGSGTVGLRGAASFTGFQDLTPPASLKGVSFMMLVEEGSFHRDASGDIEATGREVMRDRPAPNSLFWNPK